MKPKWLTQLNQGTVGYNCFTLSVPISSLGKNEKPTTSSFSIIHTLYQDTVGSLRQTQNIRDYCKEQICSKAGVLREVMHVFYIYGIYMGVLIKTKPQVLNEAMGNSCCEHLLHEHDMKTWQDFLSIIRTVYGDLHSYHKAFRGEKTLSVFCDSLCTSSKAWF